jgi:hypothetical protein
LTTGSLLPPPPDELPPPLVGGPPPGDDELPFALSLTVPTHPVINCAVNSAVG